jgi:outer membrane protein assembly factor BamA
MTLPGRFLFVRLRHFASAAAALLTFGALTGETLAQTTRAGEIEQQITQKASQLRPYTPGKLERAMIYVEENNILRRLSARPPGWYPRIGGLTTGSGFALGPGYRNYFGRDGMFDVSAAASLKRYNAVNAYLRTPAFAGDRLAIDARAQYHHYPEERYFGLGNQSHAEDRVSYLFEDRSVAGGLLVFPNSRFRGGLRFGRTTIDQGSGRGNFPSIETVFDAGEAPALGVPLEYFNTEAHVEFDYRDNQGNARSGGRHRLTVSRHDDRGNAGFAFRRVDVESMQLFPFFDKRRVIALRAVGAFTDADPGDDVPFYLMPFVGGPETLRGYRERRFTDRNLLLLQAEYRYEVFAALDMALFFDAGSVASRVSDLRLDEMKTDYGIGFRFGTRENVVLRFDIGLGGEGTRYFVKFGPVF